MHASVLGLAGGIKDLCEKYRGRTDVPQEVLLDIMKIESGAHLIQDAEQKCYGCDHRLCDHDGYGGCNVSLPPPPNESFSDRNRTKCRCDMFRRKED